MVSTFLKYCVVSSENSTYMFDIAGLICFYSRNTIYLCLSLICG